MTPDQRSWAEARPRARSSWHATRWQLESARPEIAQLRPSYFSRHLCGFSQKRLRLDWAVTQPVRSSRCDDYRVKLDGARTLLTGASGAIGHAIARAMVARGADMGWTGCRVEVLESLATKVGGWAVFPGFVRDAGMFADSSL